MSNNSWLSSSKRQICLKKNMKRSYKSLRQQTLSLAINLYNAMKKGRRCNSLTKNSRANLNKYRSRMNVKPKTKLWFLKVEMLMNRQLRVNWSRRDNKLLNCNNRTKTFKNSWNSHNYQTLLFKRRAWKTRDLFKPTRKTKHYCSKRLSSRKTSLKQHRNKHKKRFPNLVQSNKKQVNHRKSLKKKLNGSSRSLLHRSKKHSKR